MVREKLGNILVILVGLILILSSIVKLVGLGPVAAQFMQWGLSDFRIFIGALELVLAVLLLVPHTKIIGSFLTVGYFGGAFVVHLTYDRIFYVLVPVSIIFLLLLGLYLERPEIYMSKKRK